MPAKKAAAKKNETPAETEAKSEEKKAPKNVSVRIPIKSMDAAIVSMNIPGVNADTLSGRGKNSLFLVWIENQLNKINEDAEE